MKFRSILVSNLILTGISFSTVLTPVDWDDLLQIDVTSYISNLSSDPCKALLDGYTFNLVLCSSCYEDGGIYYYANDGKADEPNVTDKAFWVREYSGPIRTDWWWRSLDLSGSTSIGTVLDDIMTILAATDGGEIIFSRGTYLQNSGSNEQVEIPSNVIIRFEDNAVLKGNAGKAFFNANGNSNIQIYDAKFDGDFTSRTGFIDAWNASNIKIHNAYVYDVADSSAGYGVFFAKCDNIEIWNSRFENIARDAIQFKSCTDFGAYYNNISVNTGSGQVGIDSHDDVKDVSGTLISSGPSQDGRIFGNTISGTDKGITIQGQRYSIKANIIRDVSSGIVVTELIESSNLGREPSSDIRITANEITEFTQIGIDVRDEAELIDSVFENNLIISSDSVSDSNGIRVWSDGDQTVSNLSVMGGKTEGCLNGIHTKKDIKVDYHWRCVSSISNAKGIVHYSHTVLLGKVDIEIPTDGNQIVGTGEVIALDDREIYRFSLDDSEVESIEVGSNVFRAEITIDDSANHSGTIMAKASAPAENIKLAGGTALKVVNYAVSSSTGNPGEIVVGVNAGGEMSIVNRTGSTQSLFIRLR